MATSSADFETFMNREVSSLRRIAFAWSNTVEDADDALQETLERLYSKWKTVEQADQPSTYARVVLLNVLRRRNFLAKRSEEYWRGEADRINANPGVEDSHENNVLLSIELATALRALGRKQRAIVILRYVDDKSVEDVSRILGISPGSVKKQTSRAKKNLQKSLEPLQSTSEVRGNSDGALEQR